jgi:hypothetical protein
LEDFFSLFQFDVLIRPQSNFSLIPSLLHDYALLCFPSNFSRFGARPIITNIEMQVDEELCKKLLMEK